MLTGDLNVAVVEWIVQYRIKDPRQFLFHVRDVPETFRDMSEAAMRQVVGDHSVDEVLTIGREAIALQAKEELQRLCDLYGIGIEIQQLVLQDVNPPDPVKPAFNEVNQAIQEKERAINEAWADYNKAVPRAKGEAEQAVRAAEGYALERVNNAQGDAQRFEALYEEYRKAPAVTRKRIYLETMAAAAARRLGASWSWTRRRGASCRSSQLDGRGAGGEAVKPPAGRVVAAAALVAAAVLAPSTRCPRPSRRSSPSSAGRSAAWSPTPGLHFKVPVRPERAPLRQALAGVRRRRQRDPHPGQEVHLGRHLRALAHQRPAALLPGRARRARRAEPPRRHRRRRDAQRGRLLRPHRGRALAATATFQITEELAGIGSAEAMAHGRRPAASKIAQIILEKAAKITPEFGIELVDVRFKRINYVETVQQKVFERMISERKRIAERSRSEGQGRAAEIRGQKERDMLAASSVGLPHARRRSRARPTPRPPPSTPSAYGKRPGALPVPEDDGDAGPEPGREGHADPLHRLRAAEVPEGLRRPIGGPPGPRGNRIAIVR